MWKERFNNIKAELALIAKELEPFSDEVLAENPEDSEMVVALNRTRTLANAVRRICNMLIRVINALP